jgi:hypothetical protein
MFKIYHGGSANKKQWQAASAPVDLFSNRSIVLPFQTNKKWSTLNIPLYVPPIDNLFTNDLDNIGYPVYFPGYDVWITDVNFWTLKSSLDGTYFNFKLVGYNWLSSQGIRRETVLDSAYNFDLGVLQVGEISSVVNPLYFRPMVYSAYPYTIPFKCPLNSFHIAVIFGSITPVPSVDWIEGISGYIALSVIKQV